MFWFQYDRIDNFGLIDPQRGVNGQTYYKPDSNILTPPNFPVIAVLPGIVTSVQRTDYGQTVITIKLDRAFNSLATHMFFEHMHTATVIQGNRVIYGTLLGYTNYSGEGANLGVGFYSGDVYGSGNDWNILQNDLKPGGKGLLNPVAFLDALKHGTAYQPLDFIPSNGGGGGGSGSTISQTVHTTINNVPGFLGIVEALDMIEQFQPWQLPNDTASNSPGVILGGLGGFLTGAKAGILPSDGIQATLVFITSNIAAFAIRAIMVIIGIVIIMSLIQNALNIKASDVINSAVTLGELSA